ncbi:MAG: CDP-alcohol phosphatidyltransferase family protein [Verrucomicrobiaceae bacterium]|nr:CDP-alcohol phosphatidyltransferase family protein [Verrucomicrobiaceae bacterium]
MSVPDEHLSSRRVLKSRDTGWAKALASFCVRLGIPPNVISIFSMIFAGGAMACFMVAGDQATTAGAVGAWIGAAACVQFRLLANLLDGMVAVEGGKGSPNGVIFNDAPDRLADVLILVGAGYSGAGEPGVVKLFDMLPLGWCAACVALGTAYVRLLGASLTGTHDFRGPMAKPHRMAALTLGCFIELGQHLAGTERFGIKLALTVILAGGLWTCWRRLRTLMGQVAAKS